MKKLPYSQYKQILLEQGSPVYYEIEFNDISEYQFSKIVRPLALGVGLAALLYSGANIKGAFDMRDVAQDLRQTTLVEKVEEAQASANIRAAKAIEESATDEFTTGAAAILLGLSALLLSRVHSVYINFVRDALPPGYKDRMLVLDRKD